MTRVARGSTFVRKPWFWPLVILSVVALAVPAAAYAASTETFAQGNSAGSGNFALHTPNPEGFLTRNFVRVYHATGYYWEVFYCDSSSNCFDVTYTNTNPTENDSVANNAQAYCDDANDGSNSLFTCQTTHP